MLFKCIPGLKEKLNALQQASAAAETPDGDDDDGTNAADHEENEAPREKGVAKGILVEARPEVRRNQAASRFAGRTRGATAADRPSAAVAGWPARPRRLARARALPYLRSC